jgi:beta-lactamase class A
MKQEIEQVIAQNEMATVSVSVYDLATGRQVHIQPDLSYHPASTFKVCVMMELYHQAQQGTFGMDDAIAVKNSFRSIADGNPFSLSAEDDSDPDLYRHIGETLPARDLIARMITHSSNLATNILIERVTPARVTRFMRELGAKGLLVRRGPEDNRAYALGLNNAATSRGLTRILTLLAEGRVVSPEASEEMLAVLRKQHFREGIPAQLPADTIVAHKTGWNDHLYHDMAIVTPPHRQPYVLVIMTKGLPEEKEAPSLVAQISRLVYATLAPA